MASRTFSSTSSLASRPIFRYQEPRRRRLSFFGMLLIQSIVVVLLAFVKTPAPRPTEAPYAIELVTPSPAINPGRTRIFAEQPTPRHQTVRGLPLLRPLTRSMAVRHLSGHDVATAPPALAILPVTASIPPVQPLLPTPIRTVQTTAFDRSGVANRPTILPAPTETGTFDAQPHSSGTHRIGTSARPVEETDFGAAALAPKETAHSLSTVEQSRITPVAIHKKPAPIYTEEGRRLHIEGEVLLNVIFTARGDVHVVRILKGLGHGLDEAAIHAAEGIRFTPAENAGKRVDCLATVHIAFSLSQQAAEL